MDIDKIVADNMGLVYKQLHKLHCRHDEDAFSMGLEALASAAMSFDESKNIKFSTYASVCIYNGICLYLRRLNRKKQLEVISYEELMPGTDGLTIFDTLYAASSPAEDYLEKELYAKLWEAFDKVYDSLLTDVEKRIVQLWRESEFTMQQSAIAREAGVSQSHVSRTLGAFKHKLKKEMEEYLC